MRRKKGINFKKFESILNFIIDLTAGASDAYDIGGIIKIKMSKISIFHNSLVFPLHLKILFNFRWHRDFFNKSSNNVFLSFLRAYETQCF